MTDTARTELKEMLQEAIEVGVQQRSGSHSDILSKLGKMEKKQDEMAIELQHLKETLEGWKSGTKIAFWVLVTVGGLATWILKTFGIKIGLR